MRRGAAWRRGPECGDARGPEDALDLLARVVARDVENVLQAGHVHVKALVRVALAVAREHGREVVDPCDLVLFDHGLQRALVHHVEPHARARVADGGRGLCKSGEAGRESDERVSKRARHNVDENSAGSLHQA